MTFRWDDLMIDVFAARRGVSPMQLRQEKCPDVVVTCIKPTIVPCPCPRPTKHPCPKTTLSGEHTHKPPKKKAKAGTVTRASESTLSALRRELRARLVPEA